MSDRKCQKCHAQETDERPLYFVSFGPGIGGVYCDPCGNGDWLEMVSK